MSDTYKYPQIKVELISNDGNAFSILGSVKRALKNGGVSADEITKFYEEATRGDYNHLLSTVMDWVVITGKDEDEGEDRFDEDEDDEICPDCCESLQDCICDEEDYNDDEDDEDTSEEDNRGMLKDCGIKQVYIVLGNCHNVISKGMTFLLQYLLDSWGIFVYNQIIRTNKQEIKHG